MRKQLLRKLLFIPVFLLCTYARAQTLPNQGTAKRFVVFSSAGLITNNGTSFYTGDVGNNTGLVAGFGNFDGNTYTSDAVTQQAATDLGSLVTELNSLACNVNILNITATDTRFSPGVYCVSLGATLSDSIVLDAGNDPDAVFVFNISGALTFMPNTRIYLVNQAQACRVFWNVSGLVNVGVNSMIRGNIIGSNPALNAITLNAGTELEGRVLATTGAVTLTAITAKLPLGCDLPVQTGPVSPNLRSANCYALFSSAGNLSNTGTTTVQGRIGTDLGTVTGYQASDISQGIAVQDASTAQAKTDIELAYNYINGLPHEVDVTFPLAFGEGMSITPRVYRLNSSARISDTLWIDAQDLPNGVFVIKVNGDLDVSANAKVVLANGAKSCNVFWQVTGEVNIGSNTLFTGNLITNDDATISATSVIDGRIFTRSGNIATTSVSSSIPAGCGGCPFLPGNNPPNAVNDYKAVAEDANTVIIAVLNNDNDPDGDPLTVTVLSPARHGTTSTNGTSVFYKPQADFSGFDTIHYRVCDNGGTPLCDSAFVFINVLSVNDKPVAVNDTAITRINNPVTIPVLANDSDVDGTIILSGITQAPDSGSAAVSGNTIVYTPDPDFEGFDTLLYAIRDNGSPVLYDTAMVVIEVTSLPFNRPPVANRDGVDVCRNSDSNNIQVLSNDFDPDADTLTVTITAQPARGSARVVNGSSIVYTPAAGFTGLDSLIYQVCDSEFCDTSVVFIRILPQPLVSAGPDRTIEFGDSVIVGSSTSVGYTYSWEPRSYISDPAISNPFVSPPGNTTYTLTVTETATGCTSSEEVMITLSGDGFYNGLTPNNDGVNDYWKIPALNKYPQNEVTVINRYGSEVWKARDYDNRNVKFTGTNMNGDPLPDGTYYYVITYNNTTKEGWVVIKR